MTYALVHVRCNKAGAARREKRNGRDVIIVPAATMPDNVIMNDISYSAEEIEKSYMTLERTPAPLGHPSVGGKFVSAKDPEGINLSWCGSWNENVRRENGRVFLDKVIDVERANQSEGGKAVMAAIEKGDPVHTSTGLLCEVEAANGDVEYKFSAKNITFDHDAWLLGEEGAATPEQGVGVFVNSEGAKEEITVINSALTEDIERDLGWAVESAVRALERQENASLVEQIKSAIKSIFDGQKSREISSNEGEDNMADNAQFEELSAKVNGLADGFEKIGETIANAVAEAVKPIVDAQAEMKANQEAKDKAEHETLVNKVVEAKIPGFDKDVAEKMDATALNALISMQGNKKAAPLASGFAINTGDEEEDFSPLANMKGAN